MKNSCLKDLLRYIRDNELIKKYFILFEKKLQLKDLINISDSDAKRIYCSSNERIALIKMYEIINKCFFPKNIVEYIINIDSDEIFKYSIKALKSNMNDDKKLKYIKAASSGYSNISSRYAFGLITDAKLKENSEELIKMVAKAKDKVSLYLRNILFNESVAFDENIESYVKLIYLDNKDFHAKYATRLIENDEIRKDENCKYYISAIMAGTGHVQTKCVYDYLLNEKCRNSNDSLIIALEIASAKEDYQAIRAKCYAMQDEVIGKKETVSKVCEIIKEELNYKFEKETTVGELIEKNDLNELLVSLSSVSKNENITEKTKVKI